jgi:hypothetical protein
MKLDPTAKGYVSVEQAVTIICEILRLPAPTGDDFESMKACHEIIEDVEMKMKADPTDPAQKVVKYGPFLKVRQTGRRRSSLRATPAFFRQRHFFPSEII